LVKINNVFYGTTAAGGSSGQGTVYSLATSGSEKVLYSFTGGSDGAVPEASLTVRNRTLYGTTVSGGSADGGTVYSISKGERTDRVRHSFTDGYSDGLTPLANLVNLNGTLYGTTYAGGKSGKGIIFSLTP
jgi:uncharacterized repeat protein (TIGR03803 family)